MWELPQDVESTLLRGDNTIPLINFKVNGFRLIINYLCLRWFTLWNVNHFFIDRMYLFKSIYKECGNYLLRLLPPKDMKKNIFSTFCKVGLFQPTHCFKFFFYCFCRLTSPCGCVWEEVEYYAFSAIPSVVVINGVECSHCFKVWFCSEMDIFPILANFTCNLVEGSILYVLCCLCHNCYVFISNYRLTFEKSHDVFLSVLILLSIF